MDHFSLEALDRVARKLETQKDVNDRRDEYDGMPA